MTEYESKRIRLQLIHIIATLGVPFVVVGLSEYFRGNYDKRRENQTITVKCVSGERVSGQLAQQSKYVLKKNTKKHDTKR